VTRTHHGFVLGVSLCLAGLGAAAAVAPVGVPIASVHRAAALSDRLWLAGVPFSYPRANAAAWILLALALVGASAVTAALRAALRQRRAYRQFLAQIEIVGHLSSHPAVLVIADPYPQAFCAGYLRPRVYISRAALDLLSEAELNAVLAHEHHHRRVRDPLRLACGRILSQALFFLPALRALFGRYADLAELDADDAAIRTRGSGRAALASALLAFEATGAGIAPERVDWLLGRPVAGWQRPWWPMTASVVSLASLIALTWGLGRAASAQATFNVPLVSSQPCLVLMTLVPVLSCGAVVARRMALRHTRTAR